MVLYNKKKDKDKININRKPVRTHMQVECVFEYLSSRMVLKNAKKERKEKIKKINAL